MARTQYNLRNASRAERRQYREKVAADFDSFVSQDSEAWERGDVLGGVYRPSDALPALPESDLKALDTMLERYGLPRVLRSIRELADGRAPNGDFGESFEVEEDKDQWREKADALENLLATLARGQS